MNNNFLIVGLGNPGNKYEHNRHNIGFKIVDALAEKWQRTWIDKEKDFKGMFSKDQPYLLKPCTFMNDSGISIQSVAAYHKVHAERVIVIHDDLDLIFGKVRVKQGGGHGGHNGLKSIDTHIGKEYYRIRVGIGRPPEPMKVLDYVLGDFLMEEETKMQKVISAIVDAFPLMLKLDQSGFMNKVSLLTKDKI